MAKKGGDKRLKRQLAPRFWQVTRKSPRFILNTMPGPHTRKLSYPIGVVLRDLLHVCSSIREVKRSLNKGLITVDGKMIPKVSSKKKSYQYCLHDGRTFLSEEAYNVNDTCLVELPKFGIKNHVQLKEGCSVIVTRGENAGNIGKVEGIKDGSFSLPKRVLVSIGEKTVELPIDIVMAVGTDSSLIQVSK